jgi:glycosyltransferase involved in cell wall biosynthesis
MESYALRRAAHVFTICEGLRSDIVARGIPAAKVTVIPNAVDIEKFEPSGSPDEALKAKLGLAGATVLGFIGSFYAYEGLDLLLDALPSLLARRPDLRVLLVGGGPQDAALKAQAAQLGVADKIVFTGRVPHAEVGRRAVLPAAQHAADRARHAAQAARGDGSGAAAGGQRRGRPQGTDPRRRDRRAVQGR